jgi:hypothetical protein
MRRCVTGEIDLAARSWARCRVRQGRVRHGPSAGYFTVNETLDVGKQGTRGMASTLRQARRLGVIVAVGLACATLGAGAQAPTQKGRTGLGLENVLAKWTGDLDGMQERRTIRVLTAYNRSLYFTRAPSVAPPLTRAGCSKPS